MPDKLPQDKGINFFAKTNFRSGEKKFGIKPSDRRRHMYVIGKTGMGKTTMLENMTIQDIRADRGVAVVDPHGEFADKMVDYVPNERTNDVIYFHPGDTDWPIALNVMEKVDSQHRHLVASGLVGVFKKIWADSWGPRLEYLLRNAILALLEYPGSTLLGIMRMLVDKKYRNKVVDNVTDPVVKSFWEDEFTRYHNRFQVEAISPIQNKVGQFLTSPLIRNIVGQTRSSIDMGKVMDEGKILIMNLSKGLVGEDNSNLLGALMITKLQLAAMERVEKKAEDRRDFYLYVDEFQNFATESFASILSEARKYRLNLTLAHQYIAQLPEEVRDAVFGNVGTMASFRVGAEDAEFIEREFTPEFDASDLVNLPKFEIYTRLMIDGVASRPFSATTLPPVEKSGESNRESIVKVSRERHATPREEVEEKIARWSGYKDKNAQEKKDSDGKAGGGGGNSGPDLYETTCWHCGKKTKVPFEPDGIRPVYCKDCLEKRDEGKIKEEPKFPPLRRVEERQKLRKNSKDQLGKDDEDVPSLTLEEAKKVGSEKFKSSKPEPDKKPDLNKLKEAIEEATEED